VRDIKCPVCKLNTGTYEALDINYEVVKLPLPLYQRSYPDNKKEYMSPRCSKCFNRGVKKFSGGS